MNNLKDIHNRNANQILVHWLFYQDFNEQFEGYTQQPIAVPFVIGSCFIRISMNNLKDIHNRMACRVLLGAVVLSGFQ